MSAGAPFTRPREGFRFRFGGMKLNATPDSISPDKYALAVNVRAVGDSSIRTRPGQVQKFTTGTAGITDMRAYLGQASAAGNLAETPRYLVRDTADAVWLDNGTQVDGDLFVDWDGRDTSPVYMTGPATAVYEGSVRTDL